MCIDVSSSLMQLGWPLYWTCDRRRIIRQTGVEVSESTLVINSSSLLSKPFVGPYSGSSPLLLELISYLCFCKYISPNLTIPCTHCRYTYYRFFPETLRSLVGNGSIPPPRWNRALIPIIGRSTLEISSERPSPKPLPNPFKLFTYPDLCILLFSSAIPYCAFYAVTATLSSLFEETFPSLSESIIGVCFLGVGLGGICGTISVGKLLDRQYQYVKRRFEKSIENESEKNVGIDGERTLININDHEDFPIERARMLLQHVWICIFSVTTIGYGWAIQSKVNIAVPLILQFISEFRSLR